MPAGILTPMYLLDTDTLIYSLKGNEIVKQNLQVHLEDPMQISIISLLELFYGAYKSQKMVSNIAKVKTLQQTFEIVSPGKETADIFGMLKASLEKNGTPLFDFDLIIASTAMAHNLTLVTNNIRHFKRIEGLKLENWLA